MPTSKKQGDDENHLMVAVNILSLYQ